jgi:C-terminal processing protease CtpA/Prc
MRTLNAMALGMFTAKRDDGNYHFRYWENDVVKPRKKDFFTGQVYVIISGPTFSASTLFAHTMKGQSNVILLGEETGGGAYGNNGLMIPNITLPNTSMRVRIPLFRLVQYQHGPKDGRGITPDIYVPPSRLAVLQSQDAKMKKLISLILHQ